jgi:hypothetical protein
MVSFPIVPYQGVEKVRAGVGRLRGPGPASDSVAIFSEYRSIILLGRSPLARPLASRGFFQHPEKDTKVKSRAAPKKPGLPDSAHGY